MFEKTKNFLKCRSIYPYLGLHLCFQPSPLLKNFLKKKRQVNGPTTLNFWKSYSPLQISSPKNPPASPLALRISSCHPRLAVTVKLVKTVIIVFNLSHSTVFFALFHQIVSLPTNLMTSFSMSGYICTNCRIQLWFFLNEFS